jgi:hypothetical protein
VLAAYFALLALFALPGGSALAEITFTGFPCGRITAFTPPTATTAGSIRIGTTTFVAVPGSLPNPAPPLDVGAVICLTGKLDANGAFVSLEAGTLGERVVCGRVAGSTSSSATAPGTLTLVTNATWILPVGAGVALTPAQTTGSQCFKFEVNAQGNAEIVGYRGPVSGGGQLPSTSTDDGNSMPASALVVVLATALIAGVLWRLRAHPR